MTVSVVIPCYNVAAYVPECLASVYAQTYDDLEVICVDNCSTDRTLATLKELQETLYRDLIVLTEDRAGAPHARNAGLERSSGAWVQFLDADDLLLPEKLEQQLAVVDETTGFVAGAYIKRGVNGSERVARPEEHLWKGVFATRLGITSANLFNRSAVEAVGGWGAALQSSQEYDLMYRLLQAGAQALVADTPLTVVRQRPAGQISQRDGAAKWAQYVNLRIDMMRYLQRAVPSVWAAHESFFLQQLFDALRALAAHDLPRASKLARAHLPPQFTPQPSGATTPRYLQVYRLLGFRGAERVKQLMQTFARGV